LRIRQLVGSLPLWFPSFMPFSMVEKNARFFFLSLAATPRLFFSFFPLPQYQLVDCAPFLSTSRQWPLLSPSFPAQLGRNYRFPPPPWQTSLVAILRPLFLLSPVLPFKPALSLSPHQNGSKNLARCRRHFSLFFFFSAPGVRTADGCRWAYVLLLWLGQQRPASFSFIRRQLTPSPSFPFPPFFLSFRNSIVQA